MDQACEVCDSEKAMIYCKDCPKIHIYCQNCFDMSHKSDTKKAHKTEVFNLKILENIEKPSFCTFHPKEIKKYACLDCKVAICGECGILGKHVGHKFSNIQDGLNVISAKLKKNLDAHKNTLKLTSDNKANISKYLLNKIKWLKDLSEKTEKNFAEFRKIIDKKEKEIINVIKEKTEEMVQINEAICTLDEKLKTTIDGLEEIISKKESLTSQAYDEFFSKHNTLNQLNETAKKWLPYSKRTIPKLYEIPTKFMIKSVTNFKLTKEILGEDYELNSKIVANTDDALLLYNWIFKVYKNYGFYFELLWRGTVDGFGSEAFHNKCNNKGPTLTIIEATNGYIFGGYTEQLWNSNGAYYYDKSAFIYSLTHKRKYSRQMNNNSICSNYSYGPIFGSGYDICISDNCNENNSSYSNSNSTYKLPANCNRQTYLAGSYNFTVKEIEVFIIKS